MRRAPEFERASIRIGAQRGDTTPEDEQSREKKYATETSIHRRVAVISRRRGNAAGVVISLDSRPQRHLRSVDGRRLLEFLGKYPAGRESMLSPRS